MARKRSNKGRADLAEYRRKRDFERTSEPAGGDLPASESGRLFVVQKHAARQLHYDLRLELDGTLKSWALPRGPSLDPKQRPLAVLVEDHPIEYGAFEGIIPKGEYGGGTVMLWDHGRWESIGDPVEGFARGDLKFRLFGEKLAGAWALARMGPKAGEGGKNWLLIKKKDDASRSVQSFNVLAERPFSVLSGRTMEQIADDPEAVWTEGGSQPTGSGRKRNRVATGGLPARAPGLDPSQLDNARQAKLPDTLKPQLATRVPEAPHGDDWLHEIKLDGYRMMCRLTGGTARLLTRNGFDWTDRMPDVARAAESLPVDQAIIDGEVVILDARGISDFQALQNAFRGSRKAGFVYFVFDVPFAGGYDLRRSPLLERKRLLKELLDAAGPAARPVIQFCDHIVGKGPVVFQEAARSHLEGIISKRVGAAYESRRTDSWLKVKCIHRQDFVVGGFTLPAKSRSGIGALLLGLHDPGGRLVYRGRVGTGFTDASLEELAGVLEPLVRDTPPFVNPDADPEPRSVRWVEPQLVAEVEFIAWTDEGLVRHASFRGLRDDIDPADVGREVQLSRPRRRAGKVVKAPASPDDAFVAGVRISHPQRTVYPEDGVTKLDVARYYETIADRILPFVVKRPLSLVRCPLGLAGEAFYQRELGEGFPEKLRGLTVARGRKGSEDHAVLIDDAAGLIALAQMGVLEIHTWGCREDNLDRPDHLVFDLDPGPGIEWEHVVESARFVRDYLVKLDLKSFVKTSGGKGLHVVVPIARRSGWEEAKAFSKAIADDLVRIAPMNFVATMAKSQRQFRIFIDYLRNQLGSTSIAPYSTRALTGATVSTPLSWQELSAKLPPRELNVRTVPARLTRQRQDPWEGFRSTRQSITAAMKRSLGIKG